MTTTTQKTELLSTTFQKWKAHDLPEQLRSSNCGNHGITIPNGLNPPPPTMPGPKPNIDDPALNMITKLPAQPPRQKYPLKEFSPEQIEEARRAHVALDRFDLGLTSEGQIQFDKDVKTHDDALQRSKVLISKFNADDKQTTDVILNGLGLQTMAKIKSDPDYKSLFVVPPDDVTLTSTALTLIKMLTRIFSAGDTADLSTSFKRYLDAGPDDYSSDTIHQQILRLEELSHTALDALTDSNGNIKADMIKALTILRYFAKQSKEKLWVTRAIHKILSTKPPPGSILISSSEIKAIILAELQMSATIDNKEPEESATAAAFVAASSPTQLIKTGGAIKPTKIDCKWCLVTNGKHNKGHLAEICSNNPANAGKPRPPPRHPKTAPTGLLASTPGATTAPSSPPTAGGPDTSNLQLEHAKLQGKFDTLMALISAQQPNSPGDYNASSASSVITTLGGA